MKAKIAVLVSGSGTNLQALIDADIPSGELALVVSSKADAYALIRAEKAGIPTEVVHRDEEKLLEVLKEYDIDMIVLAGYLSVLSENFVKHYEKRIINVHPSLIPSFCGDGYYGLRVHREALEYGVKITGATVHYVNEITDGGEIIFQKAVEVLPEDTPESLQKRVMEEAEWVLLPKAAEKVANDIIRGIN
ncbi:MAG: phosphoribosylglycinamide formyltransferase [Ruminococcaceae bacterium]|nr:phosphoribosylglycinamide formyltransferase [Oscillospiraceae bacterium]